jgi:pimeloyl-ACP methyl ester carboxylesterase
VKAVVLHAWPLDERMWEPQLGLLHAAGFETVVPRLYGRGPSIEAWASQLLGESDGQFVAVGASMGGYTALALARRSPERVVGMALLGSPVTADTSERRAERDELIAQLRSGGVPADLDTDVEAEDLAVAQEAIRDRPDSTSVVGAFGGPLLVCVGDRDDVLSVGDAQAIADRALRGTLHVFPGAGHLVSVEQPSAFGDVVLEFLSQWT